MASRGMTEKPTPPQITPREGGSPLVTLTTLARHVNRDRSVIQRLIAEGKIPVDRCLHVGGEPGAAEPGQLQTLFTIVRISEVREILAAEEAERQVAKAGKEAQ
jgi:hypothetical protein